MDAIKEAREIVAERLILTQARQLRTLSVQREIEAAKVRVLTVLQNPLAPTLILLACYYAVSLSIEYFVAKKEKQNA